MLRNFTPRDEEREWLSASPDELADAQSDLKGLSAGFADLGLATGEFSASALSDLDFEVAKIPAQEKCVFLEAIMRCPELVDDEHKMAFLRRDEYDTKMAARRLVDYWEYKHSLFGPEKCFLPTTLQMIADDMPALLRGAVQLLPVKDACGRGIIFADTSRFDPSQYERESMLRSIWYIFHVAIQDPSLQELGVVLIAYAKNERYDTFDPQLAGGITDLHTKYLPLRCRSWHLCPPACFHIIGPILKFVLIRMVRLRFKVHYGSEEQVLESLSQYGLPRDRIPSEMGGDLIFDFNGWLKERFIEELAHTSEQGNLTWGSESTFEGIGPSLSHTATIGIFGFFDQEAVNPGVCGPSSSDGDESIENEVEVERARRRKKDRNFTFRDDRPAYEHDGILRGDNTSINMNQNLSHNVDSSTLPHKLQAPLTHQSRDETQVNFPKEAGSIEDSKKSPPVTHHDILSMKNGGDERMNRAVKARLENPNLTLLEALQIGGFSYADGSAFDDDQVCLSQRKNQLSRRIRLIKQRENMKGDASRHKKKGDERMNRAVEAKLENPELSLKQALEIGGFSFSGDNAVDENQTTLSQRKNQLCRRIRLIKKQKSK